MGIAQKIAFAGLTGAEFNQLPVVVSYLAAGFVSNSTAETVIGTFTIPAGDPTFPGGYWWSVCGTVTESGGPTCRLRLRLNGVAGTILSDSGAITMGNTTAVFAYEGKIYMDGTGASTTFSVYPVLTNDLASSASAPIVAGLNVGLAINTTVANTVVVTAQFGTASASNQAGRNPAGGQPIISGALYRL